MYQLTVRYCLADCNLVKTLHGGVWIYNKLILFHSFVMSAFSTPTSRPRQWSSPALGHKAALSATSTPLLDNIQGNDDEQERRQRRRSRVIDLHGVNNDSINEAGSHRQVKTPVFSCNMKISRHRIQFFFLYHSTAGTPAAVPKLSSAQISEHYSTCIKLSTENVS